MSEYTYQFIHRLYVALLQFWLHSNILTNSTSCRDLRVIVDSRRYYRFSEHINYMVAKAHMLASQILRCFTSRDPYILNRAFSVYVRPPVEYCHRSIIRILRILKFIINHEF